MSIISNVIIRPGVPYQRNKPLHAPRPAAASPARTAPSAWGLNRRLTCGQGMTGADHTTPGVTASSGDGHSVRDATHHLSRRPTPGFSLLRNGRRSKR